jgi:hypothetical protein
MTLSIRWDFTGGLRAILAAFDCEKVYSYVHQVLITMQMRIDKLGDRASVRNAKYAGNAICARENLSANGKLHICYNDAGVRSALLSMSRTGVPPHLGR